MAAIDIYLQQILDAVYGEEVRGSIHDSIAAMNVESSDARSRAITAQNSAENSAISALQSAARAEAAAQQAAEYMAGGVKYQNSITYSQLGSVTKKQGYMYNITDGFTADNTFRPEDRGRTFEPGVNVIYDANGFWDANGGMMSGVLKSDGSIAASYLTIGNRASGTVGSRSFSNGDSNIAAGSNSHAEGSSTQANGSNSHASGRYTIAGYQNQFVIGSYNENKSNTIFEVGGGSSTSQRSNLFEVYSDGHINVKGGIYQNGSPLTFDDFSGATSNKNGAHGMVPAPLIDDKNKYLKGDGTWAELDIPDPIPNGGYSGQVLRKNSDNDKDASWGGGVYYFANDASADAAIQAGLVHNGALIVTPGGIGVVSGGGGSSIIVDDTLSESSTNPVQNKIITNALNNKASVSDLNNKQDKLIAGSGISIAADGKTISYTGGGVTVDSSLSTSSTNPVQNKIITNALNNKASVSDLNNKQDKLIAGSGISIAADGKTISSSITDIVPIAKGGTGNDSGYLRTGQKTGTTIGSYATAEGRDATASGFCSHAEGNGTTASGNDSHAEGQETTASGVYSHAEGYRTKASGTSSHAEGTNTTAYGDYSHAEGNNYTTASGTSSHAEGTNTTAYGDYSHAEGTVAVASGTSSHAEGTNTTAYGDYSHAEGYSTTASGISSHAQGHYNKSMGNGSAEGTSGNAMVIGNGSTSSGLSNAFRVTFAGGVYGLSAFNSSGADYAEFFEWEDSNKNEEDRVGYFVTLSGEKIRIANSGDYILGIISGQPSVVGNGDEDWLGRWQRDDFGRFIWGEVENKNPETGEVEIVRTILPNPDYDNTKEYVERKDRPEWDYVGMLGTLAVRDDGTCEVNGYCTVKNGGIATRSYDGYRVISRVSKNVIKVIL